MPYKMKLIQLSKIKQRLLERNVCDMEKLQDIEDRIEQVTQVLNEHDFYETPDLDRWGDY